MEELVVTTTDLARRTRELLDRVRKHNVQVLVTRHGQPEAAIIDILDYRILRAVVRYYAQRPKIEVEAGLADEDVTALTDTQGRYDLVMAHYLAEAITLGRAAELLDLSWLDLRTRCLRLDVPLRAAPTDSDEAKANVEVAEAWATLPQE